MFSSIQNNIQSKKTKKGCVSTCKHLNHNQWALRGKTKGEERKWSYLEKEAVLGEGKRKQDAKGSVQTP